MAVNRPPGPMPGRILGLYALSVMDHDGPVYGYDLSERVRDRTGGSWRPGPGAVYPALRSLIERGLARDATEGRRRVYRITPSGRRFLKRVREGMVWRARAGPELGLLWSEVAGHDDPGRFLLDRLRRDLESLVEYLGRPLPPARGGARLRTEALAVLDQAAYQLAPGAPDPAARRRRRARA